MRTRTTSALVMATLLLGAAAAQAQPAGMSDTDDVLTSTEDWADADTNDDGTLSQAELNRAEPTLAAYFREIDANGDWRISRDEIVAWHSGPEPGDVDADELPAGAVDQGGEESADEDPATSPDEDEGTTRDRRTDDLLPDDGDEATELLPDDADDDTSDAREDEPQRAER